MNYIFYVLQFLFIAGVILLFCPPAEAYIQFTVGSLITQLMLSGFLGILITTRQSFFSLLKNTVKRINIFEKKSN